MVGIVLVSHSRALAEAVKRLVCSMTGDDLPLAIAGGSGDDHQDLGTDAMEILSAIQEADRGDGVLVLMDMGSAVLSAETAIDFLDEEQRARVRLCSAPFVEGAVAAGVSAKLGNSMDDIIREAAGALHQKREHLHETSDETAPAAATPIVSDGPSIRVLIPNPIGIHARPAARLAQEAARFKATITLRNVTADKGPVSARSLTGLITLEARLRHEIEITASGPEEKEALAALEKFIASGMGDPIAETETAEAAPAPPDEADSTAPSHAFGISSGLAYGPLFFPGESVAIPAMDKTEDPKAERQRLHEALRRAQALLQKEAAAIERKLGKDHGEIFLAQTLVLEDPVLVEKAEQFIHNENDNAAHAWWRAIREAVALYQQLNDPLLRQRAADLQDVSRAVLRELGVVVSDKIELTEPALIVVRDLTPGQVPQLDETKVRGVILLEGSKTSHSAILLRSRGIPAIAQASHAQPPLTPDLAGTVAVIDGDSGEVTLQPDKSRIEEIERTQSAQREQASRDKEASHQPAITRSGRSIAVAANVGSLADAEAAVANGADGIGLLRTEFLFMDRGSAPSEDEQYESLRAIIAAMQGREVVIRTLDAGGDKDLPYLHLPEEENPFLGVRAIRLCLRQPELFQIQLRAILRAALEGDARIMFPMIAAPEEFTAAKAALTHAHETLEASGTAHRWPIPIGMMMEVPSAAVLASVFAPQVNFFSIGTNDLTQYTFAADRGNTALQDLNNAQSPAVLALIEQIVSAAKAAKIPVAVCGEAAADPHCAARFLQIGVDELSMNPRSIPHAKQWVRGLS